MPHRPNVLWLMTDEQRTDTMGCYGSPWAHTPNLDRLAGEGSLLCTAVTPAPVCVPARASLLTARYPHATGIWWNVNSAPSIQHLVPLFAEAGYRTASFGKQHYQSENKAFQTEQFVHLSPAVHYFRYSEEYDECAHDVVKYPPEPYAWIFGGRWPQGPETTPEFRTVDAAIAWLRDHPADRPFFLRASFNGPHTPVAPPAPFDQLISPDDVHLPPETEGEPEGAPHWLAESLAAKATASRLTTDQVRKMRAYYYAQMAFLDQQFGRLLDWMRAVGLLDNTIVAFVSDHGTHLGDYGMVQKQTFYEPVVNVPFFFWYPGTVSAGHVVETPVEALSLMPTLLELAGLPVPESCQAPSLAEGIRAAVEPEARPVFSEFTLGSFQIRPEDRLVMVRDGNWKLSLCMDPGPQDGALHNLEDDPFERNNLYGRPEQEGVQKRLRALIERHLRGD